MGKVGAEIVGEAREEIIERLNRGIAAELNDAFRYLLLSKYAEGRNSSEVAELFSLTSEDEWQHLGQLIERVLQLGGTPLSAPADAADGSYTGYKRPPEDPTDLRAMLRDSLEGERAAIRYWKDLYDVARDVDPVTTELARQGMADEIEDEDELERLLAERRE